MNKRSLLTLIFCLSSFPLTAQEWNPSLKTMQSHAIGTIENFGGEVSLQRGAEEEVEIKETTSVYPSNIITTGKNSWAKVTLYDGSTFILNQLTRLKVRDPKQIMLRPHFNLLSGEILGDFRRKEVKNPLFVKVNNATFDLIENHFVLTLLSENNFIFLSLNLPAKMNLGANDIHIPVGQAYLSQSQKTIELTNRSLREILNKKSGAYLSLDMPELKEYKHRPSASRNLASREKVLAEEKKDLIEQLIHSEHTQKSWKQAVQEMGLKKKFQNETSDRKPSSEIQIRACKYQTLCLKHKTYAYKAGKKITMCLQTQSSLSCP